MKCFGRGSFPFPRALHIGAERRAASSGARLPQGSLAAAMMASSDLTKAGNTCWHHPFVDSAGILQNKIPFQNKIPLQDHQSKGAQTTLPGVSFQEAPCLAVRLSVPGTCFSNPLTAQTYLFFESSSLITKSHVSSIWLVCVPRVIDHENDKSTPVSMCSS